MTKKLIDDYECERFGHLFIRAKWDEHDGTFTCIRYCQRCPSMYETIVTHKNVADGSVKPIAHAWLITMDDRQPILLAKPSQEMDVQKIDP